MNSQRVSGSVKSLRASDVYPGLHPLEGFYSRDSQGRLGTGLRTLVMPTRAREETGVTAEILPDLTVSFQRN